MRLDLQTASSAVWQRMAPQCGGGPQSRCLTLRCWANLFAMGAMAFALSACGTPQVAHLPASGVSGPNGGSEETLHYDKAGHPHFL